VTAQQAGHGHQQQSHHRYSAHPIQAGGAQEWLFNPQAARLLEQEVQRRGVCRGAGLSTSPCAYCLMADHARLLSTPGEAVADKNC